MEEQEELYRYYQQTRPFHSPCRYYSWFWFFVCLNITMDEQWNLNHSKPTSHTWQSATRRMSTHLTTLLCLNVFSLSVRSSGVIHCPSCLSVCSVFLARRVSVQCVSNVICCLRVYWPERLYQRHFLLGKNLSEQVVIQTCQAYSQLPSFLTSSDSCQNNKEMHFHSDSEHGHPWLGCLWF